MVEQVDARKERIGPAAALKLAKTVRQIWVAKGKQVAYFNMMKDPPSDSELKKILVGPSGNLRAPTIRRGKKLLVGFNQQQFEDQLV